MKRYQFRLARVLRVRRLQEEILRAAFLEARAQADAARAVELAQAAALDDGRTVLAGLQQASPLVPARVIAQQDLLQRLERMLERLAAETARLEAQAARRADAAREARSGVRGLERLDERRRRGFRTTVEREEQAEADESAARRSAAASPAGALLSLPTAERSGFRSEPGAVDDSSWPASGPPLGPQQVSA